MEIVTTLVGLMSGYFINITNDHVLHDLISNLKKAGEPVNHDLQKAVNRSFLSALQNIALKCHSELMEKAERKFPLIPRAYPPEHREELEWLDGKHQQLALELRQLDRWNAVGELFESAGEIESLLKPEGKAAAETVRSFGKKLVAEALMGENAPQCYREKVGAELFQRMCDYFASEIKHTPEVRHIFDSQILAQLNAALADCHENLERKFENMEALMTERFDSLERKPGNVPDKHKPAQTATAQADSQVRWAMKIEGEVQNLSAVQAKDIFGKLLDICGEGMSLTLQRIEAGSIVLVFEGSRRGFEHVRSLFRQGKLKEVCGIRVEDVGMEGAALSESEPSVPLKDRVQEIGTRMKFLLEKWTDDMIWIPQWAGQPVGAAAVPKQTHSFKMGGVGEIKLDCYWKSQDNNNLAYVWVSWKAGIMPGLGLRIRFVNPGTQDILYERSLGTRMTGEGIFTSRELGFDPSAEPWAIVVIPEEVK